MGSARRNLKAPGLLVGLAVVAAIGTSSQTSSAASEVSPTGKGIAGGALLGGEIGFLTLAATGTKASWAYYTIPPLLAIGGGVGGYFIEQANGAPEVPLFMLAGGMALVIPTVVITLSATTYRPGNEDSTPSDATPADASAGGTVKVTPVDASGGAGTSTTTPPAGPAKHKPPKTSSLRTPENQSFALVTWDPSTVRVGVPAVAMRPSYTPSEMAKFGLTQRWEVHAPILNVTF